MMKQHPQQAVRMLLILCPSMWLWLKEVGLQLLGELRLIAIALSKP